MLSKENLPIYSGCITEGARRKDIAYGLVIVWALVGIAMKQSENQNIETLTEDSAIIVLLALATVNVLSKLKSDRNNPDQDLILTSKRLIYKIVDLLTIKLLCRQSG